MTDCTLPSFVDSRPRSSGPRHDLSSSRVYEMVATVSKDESVFANLVPLERCSRRTSSRSAESRDHPVATHPNMQRRWNTKAILWVWVDNQGSWAASEFGRGMTRLTAQLSQRCLDHHDPCVTLYAGRYCGRDGERRNTRNLVHSINICEAREGHGEVAACIQIVLQPIVCYRPGTTSSPPCLKSNHACLTTSLAIS